MEFQPARCVCGEVVAEIATGLVRVKCRACKRRVWVMCDGAEVRVGMVDSPLARLRN